MASGTNLPSDSDKATVQVAEETALVFSAHTDTTQVLSRGVTSYFILAQKRKH